MIISTLLRPISKPNLNGHYRGRRTERRRQLTQLSLCIYGILMSSKCGSDCILSAVCTEPRLWIALCPLRGRANQSLIPLHPGPVRVTRTIQWQQANTPADPGVRSLRNHGEPSFTTSTVKDFPQAYWQLITTTKWESIRYNESRLPHAFKIVAKATAEQVSVKIKETCNVLHLKLLQGRPCYNLSVLNVSAMIPHTWKRKLCQISSCCDSSS